jgi:hypothetical protein
MTHSTRLLCVGLDLNGDRVRTVSAASAQVAFDVGSNGFLFNTAWISAQDGFLVLDRNYNSLVDNASELFSNALVADGARGLSELGISRLHYGRGTRRKKARTCMRDRENINSTVFCQPARARHSFSSGNEVQIKRRRMTMKSIRLNLQNDLNYGWMAMIYVGRISHESN